LWHKITAQMVTVTPTLLFTVWTELRHRYSICWNVIGAGIESD